MIRPTRETLIDGRKIQVFDNLLPGNVLNTLIRRFYNAAFKKTEVGRPDTANFPHWSHELEASNLSSEDFWKHTVDGVKHFNSKNKWKVYRAYVNYSAFGECMFSHVDAKSRELTCLWYLVPEWDIDWGGETIFYDHDDEVSFACAPKAGRLVVFDSQIKHSGRSPQKICFHSRFTLAIKLEPLT